MLWKVIIVAPDEIMPLLDQLFEEKAVSTAWFERTPFENIWQFEALMSKQPSLTNTTAVLEQKGLSILSLNIEKVEDKDWLEENRKTFHPIQIGHFFIHDSYYTGVIPSKVETLVIDAATAFGTGHHETTRFCLQLLLKLYEEERSFNKVLDLGCGTGILGMAAYRLWKSDILLTDNDPEAIYRTSMNLKINRCLGKPIIAEGLKEKIITDWAPFDLILANILARPLIEMAPSIAQHLKPRGYVILSGILATQAEEVMAVYEGHGFKVCDHRHDTLWAGLLLQRN